MKLPADLKKLSSSQCEGVCKKIREILIDTVSRNGGHLASSLGTVELSVAIHRVFDSPEDKILWDVGHQAYAHKILTGRLKDFSTLRQEGGISGFLKPSESKHDPFVSGHSSNSISAALGIAKGMKLRNDNHHAVAVIGDGAFTGGMAYEGLNNAGKSDGNIIIILNHNDMSISKNVGAVAKYLTELRAAPGYLQTKNRVERVLDHTPVIGKPVKYAIKASKSAVKSMLYHSTMFEDFGFVYLGPVDGHDIKALEKILKTAKSLNKPAFVHVNTVKGKGYRPAEENPGAYHGIGKLSAEANNPEIISEDSFSAIFGKKLSSLAKKDGRICAVTAAMKYGTGLQYFSSDFKERFFDVGIAEQHAVTFCSGLSESGMLPVFAVYSSFLQRAYDQVLHDCAINGNHIVLGIDRAGVVGEDGETHQGLFDVSFLTAIPNVSIYSPASYKELEDCLETALYKEKCVVCVRYPRGSEASFKQNEQEFSGNSFNAQNKTAAVTYGRIFWNLQKAAKGLDADVLKLTKIFPLEEDFITGLLNKERVVFFEEGVKKGGIGEHLLYELVERGWRGSYKIVAAEGFVKQALVSSSLEKLGLDSESMAKILREES